MIPVRELVALVSVVRAAARYRHVRQSACGTAWQRWWTLELACGHVELRFAGHPYPGRPAPSRVSCRACAASPR